MAQSKRSSVLPRNCKCGNKFIDYDAPDALECPPCRTRKARQKAENRHAKREAARLLAAKRREEKIARKGRGSAPSKEKERNEPIVPRSGVGSKQLVNGLNGPIAEDDWLALQTGELRYGKGGSMEHPFASNEQVRWAKVQTRSGRVFTILSLEGEHHVYNVEEAKPPSSTCLTEVGWRLAAAS